MAEAVEADAAIAIAVMQAANNGNGPSGRAASVPEAVETLRPRVSRRSLIGSRPMTSSARRLRHERYERFRRHAMAVRIAADRVGERARIQERDELAVATAPRRGPPGPGRALWPGFRPRLRGRRGPRGAHPPRAARARDRPRARRGRPGPPVGPAGSDRERGRAASRDAEATPPPRVADLVVNQAAGGKVPPRRSARRPGRVGIEEEGPPTAPVRVPAFGGVAPPRRRTIPALDPRAGRPPWARRGQGLQADRAGALAVGQHGADPPSQRLQKDRRRRPRPGCPRPETAAGSS